MKTLHCKDVGFDCPGIIRAETEKEVLQLAAQHAQEAHQVTVTPGPYGRHKTWYFITKYTFQKLS